MNTQLIKDSTVIADMALGFEPEIEVAHKWDVLDRYQKAGVNYVGLALAGEFTSLETAIHYIARHRNYILNRSDKFHLIKTAADFQLAKQQNKLGLGFWLQGSNPLGNDKNMLEVYYQLGIRYMLLAYNTRNAIGDGVIEKHDAGLSAFGIEVIQEMNRVGMLIDLSHTGITTSLQAIELSNDPVIFSHSNAKGLVNHVRNLTDKQIKAVANKKGVIGINGLALFLGAEHSSASKVVEHIEYMAHLVGSVEHIALGLDLVYFHEILDLYYQKAGETIYPTGYVQSMNSFQPEMLDQLIDELIKKNYSETNIKNILGGNFIRVAQQVWK